jgi:hypothetical protein
VERLDSLIATMRGVCAGLPDKRRGRNVHYAMADIGMAAFSVFFMQSPSFLAQQRRLLEGCGRSNCQTLFEMAEIPSDNHIRAMLDPVSPGAFQPVFDATIRTLEAGDGLAPFRRLGDHVLIALDGTEYHRSAKVHCPRCSTISKGGQIEYFHAMVSAAIVAPGHTRVLPLEPEFVEPQDGTEKQDCESRACRRWLAAHGATYAHLKPVYLGDDLYSCQPICEAVHQANGNFLFVCKPASHPTLTEYLSGVEPCEHVETLRRGKARFRYTYRWLCDLPLRDGKDAMHVNWLSIEIADPKGKVTYRNSFVTDLPVDRSTIVELAACGRARWKVENESFNTLKTKGYNLEHNFGHGKENLAAVLVTLNLIAFAYHTLAELTEDLWAGAREKAGTRIAFFNHLRSITVFLVFASWRDLLATLTFEQPPPRPP